MCVLECMCILVCVFCVCALEYVCVRERTGVGGEINQSIKVDCLSHHLATMTGSGASGISLPPPETSPSAKAKRCWVQTQVFMPV